MYDFDNYRGFNGELSISKFITGVFAWMVFGIVLTGLAAAFVLNDENILRMVLVSFKVLVVVQFLVVLAVSFLINKINAFTAKALFIVYSLLTGVTLSVLALIFTPKSIITVLAVTIAIFAVMAVYGYVTKEDLSKYGSLLRAGLIAMIIVGIINLFMKNSMTEIILSAVGVIIFTAYIAYDINVIKKRYVLAATETGEDLEKFKVMGALNLYLDFINLFINLLTLTGKKRD